MISRVWTFGRPPVRDTALERAQVALVQPAWMRAADLLDHRRGAQMRNLVQHRKDDLVPHARQRVGARSACGLRWLASPSAAVMRRALRSLNPAFAAATACPSPDRLRSMYRLTWRSVIHSPGISRHGPAISVVIRRPT